MIRHRPRTSRAGRRSAAQIMADNAIPSYHEQATLVRSLSRLVAADERVDWYRRIYEDRPKDAAKCEEAIALNHAKMVTLTTYLRTYGWTWEQRQREGITT